MSITATAVTGMTAAQQMIAQTANNIANSETPGFKFGFMNLSNISYDNGVTATPGAAIDVQGSLEYSGIVTDLATSNSQGFFIVQNKLSNEVMNVATGSFRPNADNQLSYLNKYLLMGVKYNEDGSLPTLSTNNLEAIQLNYDLMSPAVATTKVNEVFYLNSQLLNVGQSSFVMSPSIDNVPLSENLNGALQSSGALQSGNGFTVNIQSEINGQIFNNSQKCIFIGAINSNLYTNTSNTIVGDSTDAISITYNGVTTSIFRSQIAGANDINKLNSIVNNLNSIGLNASISQTTNNQSMITIVPPAGANDSLVISGNLAQSLGITTHILPLQRGEIRFSSMGELRKGLLSQFNHIDCNTNSPSLLFVSNNNTRVTMNNLDASIDVLGALGISEVAVLSQGYDPYNSKTNMASGNTQPDALTSVTLIDSKGGQHIANIALKKVTDGWIQEVYISNPMQLQDARSDGLLQVTRFTFDNMGALSSASSVAPDTYTSGVLNIYDNLLQDTSSVGTFTVNGVIFSTNSSDSLNSFQSLIELANAINSNPDTNGDVAATIIQNENKVYQLKIISKTGITPIVASDILSIEVEQQLPDASQPLTITFNALENLAPMVIEFDYNNISEAVSKQINGSATANGNSPSILSDISINNNGDLIGLFANGHSTKLYKIPLATYANVNGLQVLGDNALGTSAYSGSMQVVAAGFGGTGEILSGNIESSNVDQATALASLVANKQFYNMNTKSWQTGNAILDYLLSATS